MAAKPIHGQIPHEQRLIIRVTEADLDASKPQDPNISTHGHSTRLIHADKYRDIRYTNGRTPLFVREQKVITILAVARIPTQDLRFLPR